MPTSLTKQDLIDIANGTAFLGAGGGGTLASALTMIEHEFPDDATVSLLSVTEAAAAPGLTAACCFVGSETKGQDVMDPMPVSYALDRFNALMLSSHGASVRRLAPVDIGVQGAVIPALITAQRRGMAVVDADGAGRAVPGLMVTTWALTGPPANPAVTANAVASATVVIEADTALDCHMIVNGICLANNFGVAAVVMWGTPGDALSAALPIQGTLSLARAIGAAQRTSATPVDAVLALLASSGVWARQIVRGTITRVDTVAQDYLQVTIQDAAQGSTVVKTAGENLIAFGPHGTPVGMSPDALCWMTPAGRSLSNTEIANALHTEVVLIGVAARSPLRDPRIISLFQYFLQSKQVGYTGAYTPIEQLAV
ncbi:MAG: DUF917 family protein [Gemmatimonadetes bacterium]|nr:DUF917 family protein [Gemmatimonadota bacterium]